VRPPGVLRRLRLREFVCPCSQCMTEPPQHGAELLARAGTAFDRQPKRAEYGRPLEFSEGTIGALVEGDPGAQIGLARRGPTFLPPLVSRLAANVTTATAPTPKTMIRRRNGSAPRATDPPASPA
jgi:hypothetical protein